MNLLDLLLVAWMYAILPIVGWACYQRGWNAAKELYDQNVEALKRDVPEGIVVVNRKTGEVVFLPKRSACPEPSEN